MSTNIPLGSLPEHADRLCTKGLLYSRAYAVAPKNRIITGLLGSLFLMSFGVALSLLRWWKCDTPENNDYTTTRRQQPHEENSASLSVLFIRQGELIISAWSLGDAISFKLARPSVAGSDTNVEIA
ncbi:hypothetical protein Clacol_010345 [Clathrus columnatus]|uniref:Uncharacterized protein n=1 Tax=Clathrus columnatus TaxID=1419009 RepID=A0AAV5AN40_9AGAM|nr:hypothetical protein Clacol_010345 [Clathrus columnatus]